VRWGTIVDICAGTSKLFQEVWRVRRDGLEPSRSGHLILGEDQVRTNHMLSREFRSLEYIEIMFFSGFLEFWYLIRSELVTACMIWDTDSTQDFIC